MGPTHRLPMMVFAVVAMACSPADTRGPASEATPSEASAQQTASSPGDPLLGQRLPPWQVAAWANTDPLVVADLRGKVVVVRFWTDTCPYCKASMPALQSLAETFVDQPVVFVGLFHAKPKGRPDAWLDARQTAEDWGVSFPIGHDANWATLRAWWLDTGERAATSSTIVLGKAGEVIHVHPGPVYFPSVEEKHRQQNRDFVALRDAISLGIAGSSPPG